MVTLCLRSSPRASARKAIKSEPKVTGIKIWMGEKPAMLGKPECRINSADTDAITMQVTQA